MATLHFLQYCLIIFPERLLIDRKHREDTGCPGEVHAQAAPSLFSIWHEEICVYIKFTVNVKVLKKNRWCETPPMKHQSRTGRTGKDNLSVNISEVRRSDKDGNKCVIKVN